MSYTEADLDRARTWADGEREHMKGWATNESWPSWSEWLDHTVHRIAESYGEVRAEDQEHMTDLEHCVRASDKQNSLLSGLRAKDQEYVAALERDLLGHCELMESLVLKIGSVTPEEDAAFQHLGELHSEVVRLKAIRDGEPS